MNKLIFTALLASALSTVILAQNKPNPSKKEYDDICAKRFPNARNTSTFFTEDWWCSWYCTGIEGDSKWPFYNSTMKEDGTSCAPIGYVMDQPNQYQCYKGQCFDVSDVKQCNIALNDGSLNSLETKECEISCSGSQNIKVNRTKDSPCQMLTNGWQKAQCNENGVCLGKPSYVQNPSGASTDVEATANATCLKMGQADKVSMLMLDAPCQFLCTYQNNSGEYAMNVWVYDDGTPCGTGRKCMKGRNLPTEVIDQCQGHTERIDVENCDVKCWDKTAPMNASMPLNAACTNETLGMPGTCDNQNKCIVTGM